MDFPLCRSTMRWQNLVRQGTDPLFCSSTLSKKGKSIHGFLHSFIQEGEEVTADNRPGNTCHTLRWKSSLGEDVLCHQPLRRTPAMAYLLKLFDKPKSRGPLLARSVFPSSAQTLVWYIHTVRLRTSFNLLPVFFPTCMPYLRTYYKLQASKTIFGEFSSDPFPSF